MEVASGEYGDQMIRLVKAVQDRKWEKDYQTGLNGESNDHPFLWQRTEEVKNKDTPTIQEIYRCQIHLKTFITLTFW